MIRRDMIVYAVTHTLTPNVLNLLLLHFLHHLPILFQAEIVMVFLIVDFLILMTLLKLLTLVRLTMG